MTAKAVTKYLRISSRKMRLVVDLIRRKPVIEAKYILARTNKKAARMVEKVLKSAVANAKVLKMDEARLYVSDIRADVGPQFKRFMSRSMGRADRILKRTTHLTVAVEEGSKPYKMPPTAAQTEEAAKKPKRKKAAAKK